MLLVGFTSTPQGKPPPKKTDPRWMFEGNFCSGKPRVLENHRSVTLKRVKNPYFTAWLIPVGPASGSKQAEKKNEPHFSIKLQPKPCVDTSGGPFSPLASLFSGPAQAKDSTIFPGGTPFCFDHFCFDHLLEAPDSGNAP